MYRIRAVDGGDDDIADTLAELHRLTFVGAASVPKFDRGYWWLAGNAGYFSRVGVLSEHWGHRLQLRLMRALEARARLNGWGSIVSDTTDNLPSANNFIRAGYQLFEPEYPWAWPQTLYWRKVFK